ncbi:MAG TPA: HIT family protein [Streptosporangiaceae bacterium]|jgi:diadenosine tetraphosphate (Ap4A) HIT family hydrolase
MTAGWPEDWEDRINGTACEMCNSPRLDEDEYGIRIYASDLTDAILQRADIQRGYTLVIWRGRHVNEPYELTEDEAAAYWHDVLKVARVLANHYQPLKMNYQTLGNTVPHLHTHLLPRYRDDPAPGRPFPLAPQDGTETQVPAARLGADAERLRARLG